MYTHMHASYMYVCMCVHVHAYKRIVYYSRFLREIIFTNFMNQLQIIEILLLKHILLEASYHLMRLTICNDFANIFPSKSSNGPFHENFLPQNFYYVHVTKLHSYIHDINTYIYIYIYIYTYIHACT